MKGVWYKVEAVVTASAVEAVEFAFNGLDSLGTESSRSARTQQEIVTVTAYFLEPPNATTIRDELERALMIYCVDPNSIVEIRHESVIEQDWLAEWKKHWKPVTVGRFVVAPPWGEVASTDKHIIRIEPNMAFGTGTHETTQLCLKAISDNLISGQSFLDVGTGTGILAIAAAMMGASMIVGCDIDADPVAIARKNARANNVGDQIEFYRGSIENEKRVFDVVCANLTLDAILPILGSLIGRSRKTLLLSGILVEQEEEIREEFKKFGMLDVELQAAGEWLAIVLRR